ncbi:MAG: hypothetical protein MSG64_12475 [Pyrinomonadaceae bacterium MAG19_C2-C3]|nr:hypothetical protein [Pyrinomonadaceae bacterium MAG19_C2-C3]
MASTDDHAIQPPAISDQTGQLDSRFMLWRMFCTEANIDVETMPSELDGELKTRWEKIKDSQLHQPAETTPTPPVTTNS